MSSTKADLTAYAGARVLVLGATGFIGRWTARALGAAGAEVWFAGRSAAALARIAAAYDVVGKRVVADLAENGALERLVAEVAPDVVFNLAGYGVDRSERGEDIARRINADLPERVVRAVARVDSAWTGSRVVHVGSVMEYGNVSSDLSEDSETLPMTLYGRTKLDGTSRLGAAASELGVATVTGRLFMVYGPGEHAGRLLPSLIEAGAKTGTLALSNGRQLRDFTWVVDVVEKLLALGAAPGEPGRVVNVATGVLTPVRAFVERAAKVLDVAPERLDFGAIAVRAEEMEHLPVATARLRALTGDAVPDRIEHGVFETRRFLEESSMAAADVHHLRDTCRGCDGTDLFRFLELGPQPPANALLASLDDAEQERSFPLDVWFCRRCTLVQLLDVVDPELLFGHYLYMTGASDTMRAHFDDYANAVVAELELGSDDLVVEVASNDGSLLEAFARRGVGVLGVEPARNIAALAREKGIDTVCRFFDESAGREIRAERGPAAAAVANNVLAHVDDTRGFLAGMRELVSPDGTVVVEAPYLGELLERLEYDTIYHEHLCYFSVTALTHLYREAGLSIVRIDHVPVHGGSLRVHARPRECAPDHAPEVMKSVEDEVRRGISTEASFAAFGDRVRANRAALLELLEDLRRNGKRVAAYGAPAKGNTLLNFCGVRSDLIEFTVDRNPLKVGRFLPGTHIPVLEAGAILERMPDYVMILPWNLADEIIEQQSEYRERGGQFIVPVPEPRVL